MPAASHSANVLFRLSLETLSLDPAAMLTGGMWQDPSKQKNRFRLSDQELAVLQGIMRGDRDREIAAELGVSHSAVRESGVVLRRKLRARTRTEVAMRAMQFGFPVHLR